MACNSEISRLFLINAFHHHSHPSVATATTSPPASPNPRRPRKAKHDSFCCGRWTTVDSCASWDHQLYMHPQGHATSLTSELNAQKRVTLLAAETPFFVLILGLQFNSSTMTATAAKLPPDYSTGTVCFRGLGRVLQLAHGAPSLPNVWTHWGAGGATRTWNPDSICTKARTRSSLPRCHPISLSGSLFLSAGLEAGGLPPLPRLTLSLSLSLSFSIHSAQKPNVQILQNCQYCLQLSSVGTTARKAARGFKTTAEWPW